MGDYGYQDVANAEFDITDILEGQNRIKMIGTPPKRTEDLAELSDFVSYYLPQFVKVEQSRHK